MADGNWLPSTMCESCVGTILKTQFHAYKDRLAKSDCKAEQRRMLKAGPPVNISVRIFVFIQCCLTTYAQDKHGFPCPEGHSGEVHKLWYASSNEEASAKLDGSLEGEERMKWWKDQKAFLIEDEVDEDDDKDNAN